MPCVVEERWEELSRPGAENKGGHGRRVVGCDSVVRLRSSAKLLWEAEMESIVNSVRGKFLLMKGDGRVHGGWWSR